MTLGLENAVLTACTLTGSRPPQCMGLPYIPRTMINFVQIKPGKQANTCNVLGEKCDIAWILITRMYLLQQQFLKNLWK